MAVASKFPAIRPTLDLNFAGSKTVDPRITFTRNSTATYFDESGVLRSAASGVPRIDHDPVTGECLGLLIEEQRTNLLTYSEQLDNAAWLKGTPYSVTPNADIAPDGTQTADLLVVASGQSSFNNNVPRQVVTKDASAIQYARSAYFKAYGATTSVRIMDFGVVNSVYAGVIVSLIDGSVITPPNTVGVGFTGASVSVLNAGNGWWRVALTYTTDTHTSLTIRSFPYVGASQLVGDGTSGIYIWGAQFEVGAFPTSYIKTEASAVTRAADNAMMTGSNFSSWFNQAQGSFFAEHSFISKPIAGSHIFYATDDVELNSIRYQYAVVDDTYSYFFRDSDTPNDSIKYPHTSLKLKLAASYYPPYFDFAKDGVVDSKSNVNISPSGINKIGIGFRVVQSNGHLNGHIKRLAYYPRRLTNDQLAALTQ